MNFTLTEIIPAYPLHWTTIAHYILLLGTLAILALSGDKSSLLFTLVIAALAVAIGVDLYVDRLSIPRFLIYLIRVVYTGIPVVVAGMGVNEYVRRLGAGMTVLAAALLALTYFTCTIGPTFGDPRIWGWC